MHKNWVVPALAGLIAAAGVAYAAPDVAVLPAEIQGAVLQPDGSSPLKDIAVKVWNSETEEIVYRTRSDENGLFSVPRYNEGEYYVTAGPVRIDMRVLTPRAAVTPQPHGFVIVVPKRLPIATPLVPATVTAAAAAAIPTEPEIVSP